GRAGDPGAGELEAVARALVAEVIDRREAVAGRMDPAGADHALDGEVAGAEAGAQDARGPERRGEREVADRGGRGWHAAEEEHEGEAERVGAGDDGRLVRVALEGDAGAEVDEATAPVSPGEQLHDGSRATECVGDRTQRDRRLERAITIAGGRRHHERRQLDG